jgi:hypothetical protein
MSDLFNNQQAVRLNKRLKWSLAACLFCGFLVHGVSNAQQSSDGSIRISRHTIDNGGGRSSSNDMALTGSIGQADASIQSSTGQGAQAFRVSGGFLADGELLSTGGTEIIFANSFESPLPAQ